MNTAPHHAHGQTPALDHRVEDDLRDVERDQERLRQVTAALAGDEKKLEHDLHRGHSTPPEHHKHHVQMNYHELTLHGDKLTGHQIKEQAIAAGITNIEVSFHVTVERGGHDVEYTIGDDEAWTVHTGDCFTAVKPDDNS